ncbi:dihydropyrimidinase [Bariatricus sp. SGI.154]|uniref:dihydropyrimidinase n=1 Tax=Bariatricus sp. SGI.154 TaxID=3420549 RepID=UPI003CFF9100
MKRLFRGGTVVSGDGLKKLDVLVKGEKILAMGEKLAFRDVEVIDVRGKLLLPGFVDSHIHMDQEVSGILTADGMETGTKAELAGGTTCVVDYAVQESGKSLEEVVNHRRMMTEGKVSCDYALHLVLTEWNEEISEELGHIVEEGIHSFRLYMPEDTMTLDDQSIYEMLARVKELGGIAGFQCENRGIIAARMEEVAREKGSRTLISDYPYARPVWAEVETIGRILKIARCVDTPVVIVNLSSKEGYEEIRRARESGQTVYVETSMPYLFMDESKYILENQEAVRYLTVPPLRGEEDRETLWKALKEDTVQAVASDHWGFTDSQKAEGAEDFAGMTYGMPGAEERPALMHYKGVGEGMITMEQMCKLLSENPARLCHLYPQKGAIAPGSDADIVVWNPETEWKVEAEKQQSACGYSLYEGTKLKGRAEQVYLRGNLVAEDGQIREAYAGQYIEAGR